jgi:hypothetical protein
MVCPKSDFQKDSRDFKKPAVGISPFGRISCAGHCNRFTCELPITVSIKHINF